MRIYILIAGLIIITMESGYCLYNRIAEKMRGE